MVFSCGKLALSAFWQEGLLFPRLALRNFASFSFENAHYRVFAVSFAISSAFVLSLRAVLMTLIGWGL
jgi:hypothetical protein